MMKYANFILRSSHLFWLQEHNGIVVVDLYVSEERVTLLILLLHPLEGMSMLFEEILMLAH